MKLYNPFKPHIVEFTNGTYAVRKYSECGWVYLDMMGNYWWNTSKNVSKYCVCKTHEVAAIRLNEYKATSTLEVRKVYV